MLAATVGIGGAAPPETTTAGKFRYVQRTFWVDAELQSTLQIARCPRRTHVYGGGTTNEQEFGRGGIIASIPVDLRDRGVVPDDGWAVRYDNYSPTPISAVVTAVCGRAAPTYRSVATQVPAQRSKTLTARCPRGTSVWGGGAIIRGPYNTTLLSQTFPKGARAWTSTLANYSAAARRGTIHAICGRRRPRVMRESTTVIPDGSTLSDADCPNQRFHLISGGASNTAPGFIGLGTLNPADRDGQVDEAPDDEMTAWFHSYTDSEHQVTVHAVCLR